MNYAIGYLATIMGTNLISLPKAKANGLKSVSAYGKCEQNGTPTPSDPVDIVCNNGTIKARHQSGLPLGYQKVEWITSNIKINFNFNTTDDTEIEAYFFRTNQNSQYLYQSDGSSSLSTNTTAYLSNQGNWRFGNTTAAITISSDIDYVSLQNKEGVWLNNSKQSSYSGVGTFTSTNTFGAFGSVSGSPGIRLKRIIIKSYTTKEIQHNYIPCIQVSDNSFGFYDTLNNEFYTEPSATITVGNTVSDLVEIYTDGTTETIADSLSNTATAEMLLSIGDYKDVQSILDGSVTRNIGIKVLDGTEEWTASGTYLGSCFTSFLGSTPVGQIICSHFQNASSLSNYSRGKCYKEQYSFNLWYGNDETTAVAELKQYLADQYASGTPVIVIYPLSTSTTETVTGQAIQVQKGNNILQISQASISSLELSATYKRNK